MVEVFECSEDTICINITRIGEFTKEELAILKKAKALAELNDPIWDKMNKKQKGQTCLENKLNGAKADE